MTTCRNCNNELKYIFLSLGNSPLANSYLSEYDLHKKEEFYPLEVYTCDKCFLTQLEEFEKPENIFTNYPYFASFSDSWLKHCERYVNMVIERFDIDKNSFVVEIASNDGYLLQYFKQHNISILGIESAANVADYAIKKGIPTNITFFNTLYARKMKEENKLADLVIGNNILAHNPDLNDFVEGLKIILKPNGIITMEFPHLLKIIEENQFDTIYHEHYSYLSFYIVQRLFDYHKLTVFDVEEIPTHGGSIRIYCKHKNDRSKIITNRVYDLLEKEKSAGLLDINTYYNFGKKVESTKRKLLQLLIQIKNEGQKIVGYGAPAKGNTLLNYCGIRTDFIDYTVDRNPYKQNKYLPGTHIPIKDPDYIRQDRPDYVLILPWNIKEEIMNNTNYIYEWGGKFIIPIPEVMIVDR